MGIRLDEIACVCSCVALCRPGSPAAAPPPRSDRRPPPPRRRQNTDSTAAAAALCVAVSSPLWAEAAARQALLLLLLTGPGGGGARRRRHATAFPAGFLDSHGKWTCRKVSRFLRHGVYRSPPPPLPTCTLLLLLSDKPAGITGKVFRGDSSPFVPKGYLCSVSFPLLSYQHRWVKIMIFDQKDGDHFNHLNLIFLLI